MISDFVKGTVRAAVLDVILGGKYVLPCRNPSTCVDATVSAVTRAE